METSLKIISGELGRARRGWVRNRAKGVKERAGQDQSNHPIEGRSKKDLTAGSKKK